MVPPKPCLHILLTSLLWSRSLTPLTFVYTWSPPFSHLDKYLAIFDAFGPPFLNFVIYMLRNHKMKMVMSMQTANDIGEDLLNDCSVNFSHWTQFILTKFSEKLLSKTDLFTYTNIWVIFFFSATRDLQCVLTTEKQLYIHKTKFIRQTSILSEVSL